ncbi:hypothetical protein [Methylobacterium aquaticum]|uniref:Uncharacterized protein n=1 Tax=Methylobacterium aquaticum TaxID=270351 RepID=A0A0J6SKG5_9HYPH|nr:hypothetical protein [Methylobacterium aquaticum]KMO33873.1 hypothetical protein VP06_15575 [Methylobacterium aquaticum]
MASPLDEARQEGITAGREWFDAIVKPHLLRLSASEDQAVFAEMEAAVEKEIPRRVDACGQDLLRSGILREKVEAWAQGVAFGAGFRAKELAAQSSAAND